MSPAKKNTKSIRYLLYAGAFIVAAYCVWHFFGPGAKKPMPQGEIAPVRVAAAKVQNVPHFLNGLGTVAPSSDVLVQSRVDGQLLKLHFTDGQRVKAGDLLAEIDPRPFKASLEQAQGNLLKDKAQLDNARRDLARYEKLAKGDFIAAQQYENQRALVRQYQGSVAADEAAVDAARLQVEYSRITAPASGRLGLRAVDEGNQIKANDSNGLVRITETSPCDVIFTLPEAQLPLVTTALREREKDPAMPPLEVQAWDRSDARLLGVGRLVSIDNRIDSATGTVRLKASFPNADDALFPNQFVNARLLVRVIPDAVTVPQAAVQLGSKGSYCYVIQSVEKDGEKTDRAEFRQVVPGIVYGELQIIDKGIAAGELVVVDGVDRLRDGIPVRIAATMETPDAMADEPPDQAADMQTE